MEIKKATIKDLVSIHTIRLLGSTADHTEFVKKSVKAGKCWLALISDKPAGFGILDNTLFYGRSFIELLIVHPEFRRRRVATSIIRKLEQICPTNDLFTSTNESNVAARKTYEANGFIRSGYVENLDEGDPEIIYYKPLKKPSAQDKTL
jgi:ribosomal protein S18 acetylase RimI-like enzyme